MTSRTLSALIAILFAATDASSQNLTVGAGSSLSLSNASVDLGCSDLRVVGTLNTDAGVLIRAVDVTIQSGGTLNGGSGQINATGDWARAGTFNPGSGEVHFGDGCGSTGSTISGDNTFNDLSLTTETGRQITFEEGRTTTVDGTLSLAGASGDLLEIRSTVDGSEAFLDLAQPASGDFVDVKDNHAIAQNVGLGPNSVITGNAEGWLSSSALPALSLLGLAALTMAFLRTGHRAV